MDAYHYFLFEQSSQSTGSEFVARQIQRFQVIQR